MLNQPTSLPQRNRFQNICESRALHPKVRMLKLPSLLQFCGY
ncbi:hypothetical protein P5673_025897, partial [Acropora cervicornis]